MRAKTGDGRIRVDWPTFWGAVFFLVLGGGFAGFGAYQLTTTFDFMAAAEPRAAIVLDNPSNCDDDGCTWWPTFQVQGDAEGQTRRTRHGSSTYSWSEDTEVDVLVNPAYDYIRIPGADNLYLLGGAFFALGMLPVIIAIWLMARMVFTRDTGQDTT
ncbi:hypothetical protein [Pseudooceanicola sp. MF1-13]|uniref:hypothetical protein n=1 Tax=Pseudooceanicola sp. MF1-13 TaxID=3379095 RepID=UPI003891C987